MRKDCVQIDRLQIRFSAFLLAAVLSLLHPVWAADWKPELEKQDNEALCLTGKDGKACYWAGNSKSAKGDQKGAEQFFRKGCDLGALNSCHGLAQTLGLLGANQEALKISTQNCEKGYLFSCEEGGYFFHQQGKDLEARELYLKICNSAEGPRGCHELAKLSKSKQDRDNLQKECKNDKPWACFVWGMAERDLGNIVQAKSVLMDGCQKYGKYPFLCEEAIKLIKAPSDVEDYVQAEASCAHWGGEESYDQDRALQIAEGVKRDCIDRSLIYESLVKKYRDSPEVVFKLQQAKKVND